MEKLDFLDGATPAEPAATPEAPAEPTSDSPARGPDGKFVSAEPPAPAAEAPPPAPAAAPPAPQPDTVPLSVVMALKDEMKGLKEQLRQPAQPSEPREPVYIDPDVENVLLQQKLNMSEDLAVDKYGEDTVAEAKAWALERFATSAAYHQEVLSQRNPYRFVVEEHKRHKALAAISDPSEYDAFLAWKASQAGQAPAPAAAAPPPAIPQPQVAAPPQSLASASSAGGPSTVPIGPGQAYDRIFG